MRKPSSPQDGLPSGFSMPSRKKPNVWCSFLAVATGMAKCAFSRIASPFGVAAGLRHSMNSSPFTDTSEPMSVTINTGAWDLSTWTLPGCPDPVLRPDCDDLLIAYRSTVDCLDLNHDGESIALTRGRAI